MNDAMPTLRQRACHGLKKYLAVTCYLWVVFGLFVLYKSVVLAEHHIPFAPQGLALLNALAFARIVLVGQRLHFGERFDKAPLIYTILFKSAAFAFLLACFKILEETLIGLYKGHPFDESIGALGGGSIRGIVVLVVILGVVLIPFFAFIELGSVLGEDKLRKLLFTSRRSGGG